jgi:hypothetical protein
VFGSSRLFDHSYPSAILMVAANLHSGPQDPGVVGLLVVVVVVVVVVAVVVVGLVVVEVVILMFEFDNIDPISTLN